MPMLERRWTVADLAGLPDDGNRYEVIDGDLLVTPASGWNHQRAVGELYKLLDAYLSVQRVGEAIMAPADVVFSPSRGVQPDLFVIPLVPGARPNAFADVKRLLLAIEVLSPSTSRTDRVRKRALYREESVEEYWVVDLDARVIERSTPADARVDVLADRLEWNPTGADAPLIVGLSDYFARVMG
jgi:Uma2 family endonuclease